MLDIPVIPHLLDWVSPSFDIAEDEDFLRMTWPSEELRDQNKVDEDIKTQDPLLEVKETGANMQMQQPLTKINSVSLAEATLIHHPVLEKRRQDKNQTCTRARRRVK
ncbi:hypothetical protein EC968_000380 [Mortierella alpina]|nr:hypothetical protein EC968_000380 [Mortierella alpina]